MGITASELQETADKYLIPEILWAGGNIRALHFPWIQELNLYNAFKIFNMGNQKLNRGV